MRFSYACFAVIIWILIIFYVNKGIVVVSTDVLILSTAIIAAGAMAGGD